MVHLNVNVTSRREILDDCVSLNHGDCIVKCKGTERRVGRVAARHCGPEVDIWPPPPLQSSVTHVNPAPGKYVARDQSITNLSAKQQCSQFIRSLFIKSTEIKLQYFFTLRNGVPSLI